MKKNILAHFVIKVIFLVVLILILNNISPKLKRIEEIDDDEEWIDSEIEQELS